MPFNFKKTNIEGLIIIEPHKFEDARGIYEKHYEVNIFKSNGLDTNFTESSDLYTKKGVIRGLHYQTKNSQAKFVRVVSGKVFDVVVDLRKESKTFGKTYSIILNDTDNICMYIPAGFAHGFLSLEESTIFSYQCSGEYLPEYCGGIRWDDEKLGIEWPIEKYGIDNIIITDKDKSWPSFDQVISVISQM